MRIGEKMKYQMQLKALEPRRWWHRLGIKRKFVDFNIRFEVEGSATKIQFVPSVSYAPFTIKDISLREIGEDLISNHVFDEEWTMNSGWSRNEKE